MLLIKFVVKKNKQKQRKMEKAVIIRKNCLYKESKDNLPPFARQEMMDSRTNTFLR